jgi:hypothetical protein
VIFLHFAWKYWGSMKLISAEDCAIESAIEMVFV